MPISEIAHGGGRSQHMQYRGRVSHTVMSETDSPASSDDRGRKQEDEQEEDKLQKCKRNNGNGCRSNGSGSRSTGRFPLLLFLPETAAGFAS